ncbi:MAG TPA: PD-(D/E)XK nuclease family protein [Planctomycetota bacterium]|nr:PD-(D/E)XK nuclease family protein [Planctomycetota bacterium]
MKTTATQLSTYWTCPYLWHVSYEKREPLPVWGRRRRFGTVIHAAIAEYERRGRSLERALLLLDDQSGGLSREDLGEARSILVWRHEQAPHREGRPLLVEGSLRAFLGGHRIDVRMDRLDGMGEDLLLAEYKGGTHVDLRQVGTQLAILAYAVLDVFGRAPGRWELELLRARKRLDLPAETDPGRLRRLPLRLIERILEGDREPRPYDPAFCSRCPAKAFCPRWTPTPRAFSRSASPSAPQHQLTLF